MQDEINEANEHLLYILTTAQCPLSCSFCMTKDLHRNLDLNLNSVCLENIFKLSKDSKKVCISGEGDPLMASSFIPTIIKKGPKQTHYEVITSGFWSKEKLKKFLLRLDKICQEKSSTVALRLSYDKFHKKQIKRDTLSNLLFLAKSKILSEAISFEIRSITGQENFVFMDLKKAFKKKSLFYEIKQLTQLEYLVLYKVAQLKLQFKPTVNPVKFDYKDSWDIYKYIKYLENKQNCEFHIGLLNSSLNSPSFNITINPNGDLVLYGLEPFILGNITKDKLGYAQIHEKIIANSEMDSLIRHRFLNLLKEWQKNPSVNKIINSVNNPFWIVRTLAKEAPGALNY